MIENLFSNESKTIFEILDVKQVSRIGWRNYFVFEFNNQEEQENYFKNLTNFKNGTPSIARFEVSKQFRNVLS